jgi:hypothetical protein
MRQFILVRFAFLTEQIRDSQVKVDDWQLKYKQALKNIELTIKK